MPFYRHYKVFFLYSTVKLPGYQLLFNSAGEYLDSNMTAEEMKKLSEYEFEDEIVILPGEMTSGPEHDEYILDDEKTYEIILKLFYKKVE